ncbi:immunoglobulin E-set [Roridomyces roridus]|uniref:Immunoglobulin E-set n=1 Tax=Roridomyces roridus TaxID=1738132 RepID=A0AAD7FKW1_9AGAR|nr:immunoglobulin E-set [Roridomyces roridus]
MNIFALSVFVTVSLSMVVAPVAAHGYVTHPPSRQAFCRELNVPGCGEVKWEPQSVEAPKGSFECNGNGKWFPELKNEGLWEDYYTRVHPVADAIPFTWHLTAPHKTSNWEYFIRTPEGHKELASFEDFGAMPPATVVQQVPLHGYTGRQTILARWNIFDTENTFYACVDVDIVRPSTRAGCEADNLAAAGLGSEESWTNRYRANNHGSNGDIPVQKVLA